MSRKALEEVYVAPRIACKKYGVTRTTLAGWAKAGKIRCIRAGTGCTSARRYHAGDLRVQFGLPAVEEGQNQEQRIVILYARVSSTKQCDAGDLERQIGTLKNYYPTYDKLISDVGSGLNFRRKGLLSLLDAVEAGRVAKVVVTYRDRLARFGIDLLERTCRTHGTTLDVVSRDEDAAEDGAQELGEDLLAVCNYFVAQNNGRRAAAQRRGRRKRERQDSADGSCAEKSYKRPRRSGQDGEDQTASQKREKPRLASENNGHCAMDVQRVHSHCYQSSPSCGT